MHGKRSRQGLALAGALAGLALLAACAQGPVSSPGLPGYENMGNTVVLQAGQQLALEEQASKYCENYWTVTFDGTAVYITLARGPSDNCYGAAPEYSAQVNGTRVQPTRVNVSPESVTFSAWTDPAFPGKVIVLWPYGWGKQ